MKKPTRNYISLSLYVHAYKAKVIREKLKREPKNKDFVDALYDKCLAVDK